MDINAIFKELAEYKILAESANNTVKELENQIKAYMTENGLDTLTGLEHIATYKTVVSNRLDSKALKADNPDIYVAYTKPVSSNRFLFK